MLALILMLNLLSLNYLSSLAQLTGAVEYADCISTEK